MKNTLLLFLSVFLSTALLGQSVTLRPNKNEIKIGEQVTVCVIVTADDSAVIQMPVEGQIRPKKIMAVEKLDPDTSRYNDSGKNLIEINQKYVITSFDTGLHEVHFPAAYINSEEYTADPFFVSVIDVEVDLEADFADVKPLEEFPYTFKELLLMALKYLLIGWGVLMVAAVIAYLLGKDRIIEAEKVTEKPKIPAHLLALEAIAKLEKSDLIEKGKFKKFHIKLSEISRRYLENRYDIRALESTTNEITISLHTVDVDAELKEKIIRALSISDLVKFAKVTPAPSETDFALKATKTFVEKTKQENKPEENEA